MQLRLCFGFSAIATDFDTMKHDPRVEWATYPCVKSRGHRIPRQQGWLVLW